MMKVMLGPRCPQHIADENIRIPKQRNPQTLPGRQFAADRSRCIAYNTSCQAAHGFSLSGFIANVACGVDLSWPQLLYVIVYAFILLSYYLVRAVLMKRIDMH